MRKLMTGVAAAMLLGALIARGNDASSMQHDHAPASNRGALGTGAALARDGSIWIVGVDDRGALFMQTRKASAATWSERRILPTAGDAVAADGESRPTIAFGPRGSVVVVYTRPLERKYTGEIRLLRSDDGGGSFIGPITLHDDRQPIAHRFPSVSFDERGRLLVVWIDKRDLVAAEARAAPGAADYAGAALYGKWSLDGGRSFAPDFKIADHSCECCRIALAATSQGIATLWRHVFPGEVRDHAFAVVDATGAQSQIARATRDEWVVSACPHHGPGLARAQNSDFHAVWYGVRDGVAGVRYGRVDAAGHPVGTPRAIPDEAAEHADVATRDGKVVIVWRSFDGERTRLIAWTSRDDGATFSSPREIASTTEVNDVPRLLAGRSGFRVVWRTTTQTGVHDVAF